MKDHSAHPIFQGILPSIKIAIADDHVLFGQGISSAIVEFPNISIASIFLNGYDLLDWYNGTNADIILLDMHMPLMDGKETCKKLLKRYPLTKVIVLSAFSEAAEVSYMSNLGICAYLLKDVDTDVLINTILKVYSGERFTPKKIIEDTFKGSSETSVVESNQLSVREVQVLKLITKGKNTEKIAAEFNISTSTVKKHRENMLNKTGSTSMIELILKMGFKGFL